MTQGQRILAILSDGKRHSHHEFYGFCVLHSRISDLRKQGHNIVCFKTGGVYEYQLFGSVQEPEQVPATGGADRDRPAFGPSTRQRSVPPSASTTPESAEADGLSPGAPHVTLPVEREGRQLSVFEVAA